jgi:vesicle coat complex subunit
MGDLTPSAGLFDGEAKGELLQLRDDLDGNDPKLRKPAAKRVISLMRSGENVSSLFSSMLRCVRTNDIELKKLTYLYLMNYSTHEPEQAIMAVNTFIVDSQDANPIIRALAVRTMCRIRLENVAEYMVAPLKKTLTDEDPYVRKTAAFGVAKLFDVIPEIVENSGLIPDLQSLLHDSNPMVIANALAALSEINDQKPDSPLPLDSTTLNPVIQAVPESSAWCQIILLDGLSRYPPSAEEDADYLVDKFLEFLKHNNPAVVVGAFRCLFAWVHRSSRDPTDTLASMVPPFITLLQGTCAEIQYVVVRSVSLFMHRYPRALTREIRVFFCKYNDPTYVKMEKLDIIVRICEAVNAELVLDELSEYSKAVDVPFVRKAIRCIGQIALKIELAAPRCVDVLVALVATKADYAVEESIIVVTDIMRKFPGQFESIL